MKITQRVVPLLLSLSLLLNLNSSAVSQRRTSQPAAPTKPRLVLLIAIDQFRYDYLERFSDLYTNNGLGRLMRDGASWVNANYDHYPTYTAPGHATMMTGAFPSQTGIVGNEWPDRETGKRVSSVTDRSVKILGGGAPTAIGVSPARLMASTVGDELRLATVDRSKVIGISVKDRSAILPAGRHANAAYWLSTTTGTMVSSTYYFPELPAWVTNFNNTKPLDKYFGVKWDRLLPESVYLKRAGEDSPKWETVTAAGDTNAFPHIITGGAKSPGSSFYSALDYSPFTNDVLVSFAEQAIIHEGLGQDDDTDVLTVSFSSNDYIGHRYGPYSQEAMDAALRVDRAIASLLDLVQSKVGLERTIVALTADHGVAPIPEHAAALGLGAKRVTGDDVLKQVRSAITKRYNPQNKTPDPTLDYIYKDEVFGQLRDSFANGNIYFNYDALKRDGIDETEFEDVVAQAALSVKGVARAYTRNQLLHANLSEDMLRRVVHGFYPSRSGDVVLVPEPYVYVGEPITATHGTPYGYDTHVPVIIMGRGVTAGRYFQEASPADIAPTLAALLRLQAPTSVTGRILTEALNLNVR